MKSVICEKNKAVEMAAAQLSALLQAKPGAVLALAGGRSTGLLYDCLAKMYAQGRISFKEARILLAADFIGAPQGMSYREQLQEQLISKVDIKKENCFFISEDNYSQLDEHIEALGGIDMAVLGIGNNAHIGFNEPATQFNTKSHRQRITDATKRQNAERFGGVDKVPAYGVTMGIMTIYQAKSFMTLSFGEEKAEPVFKMFYGRNDSRFPAAFLQLPTDVCCYMDEAAGAQLLSADH